MTQKTAPGIPLVAEVLRRRAEFTQRQVGKAAGLSQSVVSLVESGERSDQETLVKIHKALKKLGVNLGKLTPENLAESWSGFGWSGK